MGTTSTFALRYPASTANAQIWAHIQSLAEDVDTQMATVRSFLLPIVKRKTIDVAVLNTALADDADIQFTNLTAGAIYRTDSFLFYEGSTTADIKIGWSCSGVGAAFSWGGNSLNLATSQDNHDALTLADTMGFGAFSPTATKQCATPGGILEAGTGAGITFKLRWAQQALDGINGTTLFAKSTVILTRLA